MKIPQTDADNIEAKCLKSCGLQQDKAPLDTTELQVASFNIVGLGFRESQHIFRKSSSKIVLWLPFKNFDTIQAPKFLFSIEVFAL